MARRARRVATTALAFLAVLTAGVLAVTGLLEIVSPASRTCTARLPDGATYVLDADQADNAALIAAVAGRRQLPARAVTIAVATALQESKLRNIDHGDRDSVGIFQQRPSQGWGTVEQIMDPVYSTSAFFDALQRVTGYEDLPITVAAQAVQRSAYPEAYARHEARSRAFASALTGYSPASLTCDLAPNGPSESEGFTARLERDWGAVPEGGTGTLVNATTLLSGVPAATAAWSVGQWAVATAEATGVSVVVVGDRRWERGTDGWQPAGDRSQREGFVLVE